MDLNEAEKQTLLGCLLLPEVFSGAEYAKIRVQFNRRDGEGEIVMLWHKGCIAYPDPNKHDLHITPAGHAAIKEFLDENN